MFCITKTYFLRYFYIIGLRIFNVGNMIFRRQTKRFVHTFLAEVSYLVFAGERVYFGLPRNDRKTAPWRVKQYTVIF